MWAPKGSSGVAVHKYDFKTQSDHSSTEWEPKNCQPKGWKMECAFPWVKSSSASTWINRSQVKENSTYKNILCLSSVKTMLTLTNGLYLLIKFSPQIKKREKSSRHSNYSKSENLWLEILTLMFSPLRKHKKICAGGAGFEMDWMKAIPVLLNPGKCKEPSKSGLEEKQR